MAGVEAGLINILIGPKLTDNFGRDLEGQLNGDLKNTGRRTAQAFLSDFGQTVTRAGKGLTAAVSAPLIAAATVAVRSAREVQSGLAEVVTLTGETGEEARRTIEALSGEVAGLSDELGVAQTEIISGLYQAISAGVPRENAFDFLRTASQAAIAGVTDIETAVDGLTTTLNAFGLPATEAGAVADSLFAAVRAGKTDFEQLSRSLFNVAPAAAAAGLDFREINAAISTLTASGTPTSVATTQIRAALVGLQRPTEDLQEIFSGLGFESRAAAIEQLGLQGSLEAVFEAAAGDQGVLQQLLGSVEAVAAANVLAGTSADKFASDLEGQAEAAGAALDAFEVIDETRVFARLQNDVDNLKISLGQVLLPVLQDTVLPIVTDVVERVKEWIAAFRELPQEQQDTIVKAIGLAAALGPVLLLLGGVASGASALIGLLGALASPVGLFAAALAGVVALVGVDDIGEKINELAEKFEGLPERVRTALEDFVTTVEGKVGQVVGFFSSLNFEDPEELGRQLAEGLGGVLESALENLGSFGSKIVEKLDEAFSQINWIDLGLSLSSYLVQLAFGFALGVLNGTWFEPILQAIRDNPGLFIGAVVGLLFAPAKWVGAIAKALTKIPFVGRLLSFFVTGINRIGAPIRGAIGRLFNGVKDAFLTAIRGGSTPIVQQFRNFLARIPAAVNQLFDDIVAFVGPGLNRFATAIGAGIRTAVTSIGRFLADLVRPFTNFGRGLIDDLFSIGRNAIRNLVDGIRLAARNLKTDIINALDDLLAPIRNLNPAQALRNAGQSVGAFFGDLFRADGGPVAGGQPYIVGERGPELIVPRRSGTVIPNEALGGLGGDRYEITIVNPVAEEASLSIPNALRRAAYLRG